MFTAARLFDSFVNARNTHQKLRAVATLIMWFSAGAYVTSVASNMIDVVPDGVQTDFVGGAIAAIVGVIAKAV